MLQFHRAANAFNSWEELEKAFEHCCFLQASVSPVLSGSQQGAQFPYFAKTGTPLCLIFKTIYVTLMMSLSLFPYSSIISSHVAFLFSFISLHPLDYKRRRRACMDCTCRLITERDLPISLNHFNGCWEYSFTRVCCAYHQMNNFLYRSVLPDPCWQNKMNICPPSLTDMFPGGHTDICTKYWLRHVYISYTHSNGRAQLVQARLPYSHFPPSITIPNWEQEYPALWIREWPL